MQRFYLSLKRSQHVADITNRCPCRPPTSQYMCPLNVRICLQRSLRLVPCNKGAGPAFDYFVDFGHQADGFFQGHDDLPA